jgi:CheY-like chemotaxis protein
MKQTILVIDDDYFVRTLLNFLLQDFYEVVTIENGYKAMLWLDKGNIPDAIITDMDMPRLNGFSFLSHLQKSGYYRDIPVIVLSGNSDLKEQCMVSGASGFISKPFNPPDLLNVLKGLLQSYNTNSLNS